MDKLVIDQNNFFGFSNPRWWTQEGAGVFQLCYPWAVGFVNTKKYYSPSYEITVLVNKGGYMWQILEESRSYEMARAVHHKFQQNQQYLDGIRKKWHSYKEQLRKCYAIIDRTKLKLASDTELWQLYDQLYTAYIEEFTPALLMEAFVPYSEIYLLPELAKTVPKEANIQKSLTILTAPLEQSFITQERISFLELLVEAFKDKELAEYLQTKPLPGSIRKRWPHFYEKLAAHQQQFFWVKSNYKNTKPITVKQILAELISGLAEKDKPDITEELQQLKSGPDTLKQQKEELRKKFNLNTDISSLLLLLEKLGQWQDERKKYALISSFYLNQLLLEVSRRSQLPQRLVQYCLPAEIKDILLSQKKPDKAELTERRKFGAFVVYNGTEQYFTGSDARLIWKAIFKENQAKEKSITGIVASAGRARGRVRIVRDPHQNSFQEGEILVTSMTRPEFVPLMKEAAAVVTDEGGLTSHAAIVSRELNIPCIVGAKVATKVFKDGDLVEVDASHGVVTKLS